MYDPRLSPASSATSPTTAVGSLDLSAIIPVHGVDGARVRRVIGEYRAVLDTLDLTYEVIVVVSGRDSDLTEAMTDLAREGEVRVIVLGAWPGAATALSIGFAHSTGRLLLTLPPLHQVAVEALPELIGALGERDMLVVRRWPRRDGRLKQLQTRAFAFFLRTTLRLPFKDLGCGVRLFRRDVLDTVYIYGDQQRFLPVLAERYGYHVAEVDLPQAPRGEGGGPRASFLPAAYVRRLLDLLSIFFLVNYTIKPLRFFGLTGLVTFLAGTIMTLYLAAERVFMDESLADRPLLLLGLLLVVLGVQLFAIGLIGELIIYIHARNLTTYTIERLVGFEASAGEDDGAMSAGVTPASDEASGGEARALHPAADRPR
ncbi:hypothetical protein AWN76_015410 [Rhodothermaceae bacterium RA]|nr:hypothetical protein AWN76_015410 [Rhodothermaceae bacterium RA]